MRADSIIDAGTERMPPNASTRLGILPHWHEPCVEQYLPRQIRGSIDTAEPTGGLNAA